ncbi:hypothetical protein BCR44DRAFT_1191072 [Catenaria anguillulae PL171]|uniref:ABC-type glycine betaine transport system substrate-binding domain-containing protein n=1 Tax=Catenaria anguillulae PL171 TaxID=765915 RepID=A0A1Y2HGX9_9FUNG|nr:hypothetical protein BCR44DRAFT_1191072 [Catenaria anguillulae PL171]
MDEANVTAYIAAILLRDVMDVHANIWEISGSPQTYDRIQSGTIQANMEVWGSNKQQLYEDYIFKRGTVSDFGLVGYNGKVSLFINQAAAEAHPSVVWNSWLSLRRPEALALLPAYGTTQTAGCRVDDIFATHRRIRTAQTAYSFLNNAAKTLKLS